MEVLQKAGMPTINRDGVAMKASSQGLTRQASLLITVVLACCLARPSPAGAEIFATYRARLPFTATLSNLTPLSFGMDVEDATQALGTPLGYVSGRPGDEIYLAFRNTGGSGLLPHRHRLYLQFRHGRLAGWKGDWGHNWMWQ